MKIPGYKSHRLIVSGPFWTLFEALHVESETRHLVQVMDESVSQDRELVALLYEMFRSASSLQHDAILLPRAFEETAEGHFLVYDFFNGRSLQSLLDAHVPLVERRVLTIVRQIAEALQYAQIRGIRHGWLSPQVVLLAKFQDDVKVLGFGSDVILASLYDKRQDVALSVNPYMPPESLALATQPMPDDSYALGVLLYQLLLGKLPFSQKKIVDLKQEKRSTILPPNRENPKISHAVSDITLSLLDPRPQSRVGLNSLLNILSPPETSDVPSHSAPAQQEAGLSRVRGFFDFMNPLSKNLVGSKKRTAYTAVVGMLFLVLLLSIILFTHLSSRDERRFQRTYDEFVVEQYVAPEETTTTKEEMNQQVDSVTTMRADERLSEQIETAAVVPEEEGPDAIKTAPRQEQEAAVLQYVDLLLAVKAGSHDGMADVFVNGRHRGQSGADGLLTIDKLVADQTYTLRVEKEGFETWQQRIQMANEKKSLNIELTPVAKLGTFTFEKVPFADKIRLGEESLARNLPSTLQLPFGAIGVTFIDSKADFAWSTIVELRENNQRISLSTDNVGSGEVAVALDNASRFGYAFVTIDQESEQYATPLRKSLPVGWHRIRISRAEFKLSPADTLIFIRPDQKINIRCKVL
ncbi:protein kinase [candidate division KSB1 bacterium]|nr:protein kinase [candidate division KSB1 bacterium]